MSTFLQFVGVWFALSVVVGPVVGRYLRRSGALLMSPDTAADIDACQQRHPAGKGWAS